MAIKIFFLDFDGVICDSVNECLFSSFNAYCQITGRAKKISSLSELDERIRFGFMSLRPFVRSGEDYLLSLWMIENDILSVSQQEFDLIRLQQQNRLDEYKLVLHEERMYLLENKKNIWLDLNPLFDFKAENNEPWNEKYLHNKYILTTKKRSLVLEILKHRGINFPVQQIICTTAKNKIKALEEVLKKNNLAPEEAVLVEDQIDYLVQAKKAGVEVFLAGWGYVSEKQKLQAKELNIPVLEKDGFKKLTR